MLEPKIWGHLVDTGVISHRADRSLGSWTDGWAVLCSQVGSRVKWRGREREK